MCWWNIQIARCRYSSIYFFVFRSFIYSVRVLWWESGSETIVSWPISINIVRNCWNSYRIQEIIRLNCFNTLLLLCCEFCNRSFFFLSENQCANRAKKWLHMHCVGCLVDAPWIAQTSEIQKYRLTERNFYTQHKWGVINICSVVWCVWLCVWLTWNVKRTNEKIK